MRRRAPLASIETGGKSLSFFVDVGGGKDSYPSRPNNKIIFGEANSLFVDAPGGLESLLDNAVRRALAGTE